MVENSDLNLDTLNKTDNNYFLFSVCLTKDAGSFLINSMIKFCVFPFRYSGKVYNKCTYVDSGNGDPWCSTKTDSNDNHAGYGNWGYCNSHCPK